MGIPGAWFTGVVFAFLSGIPVQAAAPEANCVFENCAAKVTVQTFRVSCAEATVYEGPYSLKSDLRVTTIRPAAAEEPRVTLEGVPSAGAELQGALVVSGKSVAGSCAVSQ